MKKYEPEKWYWPELDAKPWFKAWNHWLNPLGNWLEPMPRPQGRVDDAYRSLRYKFFRLFGLDTFGVWFFWNTRNFASNFGRYWVGITPIGERYEHRDPEENGWERHTIVSEHSTFSWWQKSFGPFTVKLPYWTVRDLPFGFEAGIGWKDSGTLGSHFRHD